MKNNRVQAQINECVLCCGNNRVSVIAVKFEEIVIVIDAYMMLVYQNIEILNEFDFHAIVIVWHWRLIRRLRLNQIQTKKSDTSVSDYCFEMVRTVRIELTW